MSDTDQTTTDLSQAAQSSVTSAQTPPTTAPAGFVEKARLDGALTKIQELTIANRALADQVTILTQEKGKATADTATQVSALQGQVSELTNQLQAATTTNSQQEASLKKYTALETKIKIVSNDLKRPDLFSVLDLVPDGTPEEMKPKLEKLASYSADIARKREQELMSGVIHTENQHNQLALPTDEAGWQGYINSFELGSSERKTAMDAWHNQLMKPQS